MVLIREPKTFDFDFDLFKDIDKNLKRKIEFIIKSNESLDGNKMNYQIFPIQCQIFKIILNILLKSMQHYQRFLLFMFISTELIIV